jgi:hypothetical protein
MRRSLVILFLLGTIGVSRHASAQDPRRDEAARLMDDGVKLHAQKDEAGALAKFEAAYRVYPSPNVLYNVAREKQLLGRDLEAIGEFRECRRSPILDPKAATLVGQWITELEQKVGRIEVDEDAGSALFVDGQADTSPRTDPIDVAPGHHHLEARRDGKTASVDVDIRAGELQHVSLKIATDTGHTVEPPKTETRSVVFPPPTGAIILGGVGIVGLGLGVGFGLDFQSKKSDFENLNCTRVRSAGCDDAHSSGQTASTISIVSYVAGGALLAGGVVWWLVAPRKETRPVAGLHPFVGGGVGGLALDGSF